MADQQPPTLVNEIIERLSRIEAILTEDHKAIRGNGHPGLLDRVTRLEGHVDILLKMDDKLGMLCERMSNIESTVSGVTFKQTYVGDRLRWLIEILIGIIAAYAAFCK